MKPDRHGLSLLVSCETLFPSRCSRRTGHRDYSTTGTLSNTTTPHKPACGPMPDLGQHAEPSAPHPNPKPQSVRAALRPAPAQVCVDLFVMSSSYVDVATLSRLCHPTAGQLYHYCPWLPEIDASRVANDLRWNLYRPQASALRVQGLRD